MFKLKGLKEVSRHIRNLERDSKRAINKGIQQTARLILAQALANVPVKDGHLRSTLGQENLPEEMSAKVYASAIYAAYVEFGTGQFVDVPTGYEEYAMQFKGATDGFSGPKPFLFPALFANQEKLLPLIEDELIRLLRK